MAWRPGTGGVLATGGSDATAALWRPATGSPGKPIRPASRFDLDAPATAVAWLDQQRLLIATRTGTLRTIDTAAARHEPTD
jgi:hypothetical protein